MAIIGSDDQTPILYDLKPLARRARAARRADHADLPVARAARPPALPVRYKIVYGEPLDLASRQEPVDEIARRVRREVQHLLDRSR